MPRNVCQKIQTSPRTCRTATGFYNPGRGAGIPSCGERLPKKVACLNAGKAVAKAEDKTWIVSVLRPLYKLSTLLHIAGLARSTFYYQLKISCRDDRHSSVRQRIMALFHYHKGRYGYRRITLALRNEGHVINHKTVRRLMREQQLSSNLRAKKYSSYKGIYGKTVQNVLQRDFTADKPARKWVTDVTEFRVGSKKLYLSPIMDLYNSEIIAWNMDEHPGLGLVAKMLDDALGRLKNGEGLVLHSDQGWQYQMAVYQEKLLSKGLTQSMSRKGNCLDSAVIENFFGILKSECWYGEEYHDVSQLREAVDEYIRYYNHERIKVKLNGLSPVQYRTQGTSAAI